MNTRSIRFRLTAWYALVLAAGLGLLCVLVWVSLSHQLSADLDAELQGRASRLDTYFTEEVQMESGRHLQAELVEFARAFGPDSSMEIRGPIGFQFRYPQGVSMPGHEIRVLERAFSVQGRDYKLRVEAPTAEMTRTLGLLRNLLLGLTPVVILISSIGGALLSRRALRPVIALTEAANKIGIENLAERLPVAETGDELAQLASTLNKMLGRLEGAVTTLSQFSADASHEFRTPLAVLQTTVELALRRPRSAEEYRQALEEVGEEVARMTHLVEDLLTLARTDTGAVDMPRSILDLRVVLADVLLEMRSLSELRQVRIAPMDDGGPAWISGNQAALRRLFLVLMDNALKYSQPAGEVVVSIQQGLSKVEVSVLDCGSGIAPQHLPHIFKRFYRGDPARAAGGHGLGLALAESIVRAHEAEITVSSKEGESTEFRVVFPSQLQVPVSAVASASMV